MIVGDERVLVVEVLRGAAAAELSMRLIGGTASGVQMISDDTPALDPGREYVVFLEEVDWPTEEGFERVLAPVAEGQGVFASTGRGNYVNVAALAVTKAELTD